MGKINFYVFGEAGKYDNYNPYNVLNKENVSEILFLVASNNPFSIDKNTISNILDIGLNEVGNIIDSLSLINAIEIKNDTYKLNFPIFLERDIDILDLKLNEVGSEICNKIIELKEYIFDKLSKYEIEDYKR
ncbi:MAG: hypothetical protein ACRCX2_29750, partial [Paraclostridium sp.]